MIMNLIEEIQADVKAIKEKIGVWRVQRTAPLQRSGRSYQSEFRDMAGDFA